MSEQLELNQLFSAESPDAVLQVLLDLADALELETSTWHPGDPERTLLEIVAQKASDLTTLWVAVAEGGLLDYAKGGFLKLLARNVYGVDFIPATFASGKITLTKVGAGSDVIAAGDLTFQNSTTQKTYRNTSGGTLTSAATLELDILAEEIGTDSNSGATEIDTLVTTLLGVSVSNATAVIGSDEEKDEPLRQRCRDALGALSPNGPAAAYAFVAKSTKRADGVVVDINRVRVSDDSATGEVDVVLASPSGAPIAGDVTLVEDAIQTSVVPLAVTATIVGATEVAVPITYTAFVPSDATVTNEEIEDAIAASLEEYFSTLLPIGGFEKVPGAGKVWADLVRGRIATARPDPDLPSPIFSVTLAAPAADVALTSSQVAVLGTVTPTITRVVQS